MTQTIDLDIFIGGTTIKEGRKIQSASGVYIVKCFIACTPRKSLSNEITTLCAFRDAILYFNEVFWKKMNNHGFRLHIYTVSDHILKMIDDLNGDKKITKNKTIIEEIKYLINVADKNTTMEVVHVYARDGNEEFKAICNLYLNTQLKECAVSQKSYVEKFEAIK